MVVVVGGGGGGTDALNRLFYEGSRPLSLSLLSLHHIYLFKVFQI